jgi:hypothetical protein
LGSAYRRKISHPRRPLIAASLDQHIEDRSFVIDRAPEIHLRSGDEDHHLIEMPA